MGQLKECGRKLASTLQAQLKTAVSLFIVLTMVVTLVADPLGVVIATRQAIFGAQGADIASPPAIDIVTPPPAVDVTPAPPATQPPVAPPTSPPQQPLPPLETTTRPAISVTPPAISVAPSPDIQAHINYLTAAREALLAQLAELDLQIAELQYRIAQSSNLSVEDAIYILQQNIDAYNYTIAYLFNRQFAATSSDEMLEMMDAIAYYNARIQNATSNIAGLYDGTLQPSDIYTLSVEYLQYQLAELFVLRHALLVQLAEIEHELFLLLSCPLSANLIADISNYTLQAQELIAQVFELVMAHVGILEAIRYADSQAQYDAYRLQLQELYEYFRQSYDLTQVLATRVDEIEWLILANQLYQEILLTNFAALQATMYELEDLLVMFAYLHANGMPNVGMSPLTLCNPTGLATIVTDVNASVPFGMAVAFSLWPEGATRIIRLLADVEISADALTQGGPAGSELHIFSYCGCTSTGPGTQGPFSITRTTGTDRHFIVPADRTMHLYNVIVTRLQEGMTEAEINALMQTYGGGIQVNDGGSLYLHSGSVISHNRAVNGGGVSVTDDAQLTMHSGAVISHNHAINGGGIHFASSIPINLAGATIANNIASQAGGGMYISLLAIQSGGMSTTLTDTTFESNTAVEGHGGGMFVRGQLHLHGQITINNNEASDGSGGGVHITNTMTIHYGTTLVLTNNRAGVTGLAHDAFWMNNHGGGINSQQSSPVINIYTTIPMIITGNSADGRGGGIHLACGCRNCYGTAGLLALPTGTIISDNHAGLCGGGIFAGGNVTANNITVTHNTSNSNSLSWGSQGVGQFHSFFGGGGMAVLGSLTLTGTTIVHHNQAWHSGGGLRVLGHTSITGHASFEHNSAGGNSTIMAGVALGVGGGMHLGSLHYRISGIIVGARMGDPVLTLTEGSVLTMYNNRANASGGGISMSGIFTVDGDLYLIYNHSESLGGGIQIQGAVRTGSDTVVTVKYNTATQGAGMNISANHHFFPDLQDTRMVLRNGSIIYRNEASSFGGGIHTSSAPITLYDAVISHNFAEFSGGGIHAIIGIAGSVDIDIIMNSGAEIYYNRAGHGGGINLNNRRSLIMNGNAAIIENASLGGPGHSSQNGGGGVLADSDSHIVMNDNSIINRNRATVYGNQAALGGGGVHLSGTNSSLTMNHNASIDHNVSYHHGGGIRMSGSQNQSLKTSAGWAGSISNNIVNDAAGGTGARNGGGIFIGFNSVAHAATVVVDIQGNGEIAHNQASSGGGIFVDRTPISISGVTIEENTARQSGGGIWHSGGSMQISITNATICSNTANGGSANGGGIFIGAMNGDLDSNPNLGVHIANSTIRNNVVPFHAHAGGGIWHGGGNLPFVIHNSTIANNRAGTGGGIAVDGALTHEDGLVITNSFLYGNFANHTSGGGAILLRHEANLNVTNTVFGYRYEDGTLVSERYNGNNMLTATCNVSRGLGGAIMHTPIDNALNFTNVILANSRSSFSGGGIMIAARHGVPIGQVDISIVDSMMHGNRAGFGASGTGGAINIGHNATSLYIYNSVLGYRYEGADFCRITFQFEGGTRVPAANVATNGAGIWYNSNSRPFVVTSSTIANNIASEMGGGILHGGGSGAFTVHDSVISNNEASSGGGGIFVVELDNGTGLVVTDSFFYGNAAGGSSGWGGAIRSINSALDITDTVFGYRYYQGRLVAYSYNQESQRISHGNHGFNGGGAIFHESNADRPLTLANVTMANNHSQSGGGIMVRELWDIYFTPLDVMTVTITNSLMHNNTANSSGGAICIQHSYAIFNIYNSVFGYKYEDAYFVDFAFVGGRRVPSGNLANMDGGAIRHHGSSLPMTVTNSTISNNAAGHGGGIWVGIDTPLNISGSYINRNSAGGSSAGIGGGIWHTGGSAPVSISNTTIYGNRAGQGGGGIHINQSLTHANGLAITNSRIDNNSAIMNGLGGGINLVARGGVSNFSIVDSFIRGNTASAMHASSAAGQGGGINVSQDILWAQGGIIPDAGSAVGTISNTVISNNTANNRGGGMFVARDAVVYLQNNTAITNNHAGRDGGGIFTEDYLYALVVPATYYSNISIPANVTFSGNTAGNGSFRPPTNHAEFVSRATRPIIGTGRSPTVAVRATHLINNYDVNFNMLFHLVTFSYEPGGTLEDGMPAPQRAYDGDILGGNVTIPVPVPDIGYRFAGWVSRHIVDVVWYDYYYIYYCCCEDYGGYCYCFYYGYYYGYYCYCYDMPRRQEVYINIYYYGYYAYYDMTIDPDIITLRNIHFIAMFETDLNNVSVSKVLSGNMADPDTPYNFTITFYQRDTEGGFELLPASVADRFYFTITGSAYPTAMMLTNSVGQFTLLHNQTITFANVSSVVYMRIVENVDANIYDVVITFPTATGTYTIPASSTSNSTGATPRSAAPVVIGENVSYMHFTFSNALNAEPEMGVTVAATGIMLMIGLGIFAAGATVVFKSSRKKYM